MNGSELHKWKVTPFSTVGVKHQVFSLYLVAIPRKTTAAKQSGIFLRYWYYRDLFNPNYEQKLKNSFYYNYNIRITSLFLHWHLRIYCHFGTLLKIPTKSWAWKLMSPRTLQKTIEAFDIKIRELWNKFQDSFSLGSSMSFCCGGITY